MILSKTIGISLLIFFAVLRPVIAESAESGDSPTIIGVAEAEKRLNPLIEKINARYQEMIGLYGYGNAPKTLQKEFERRGIDRKFGDGPAEDWGNNGLYTSFDNCGKYHYEHHRDVLMNSLKIMRDRDYAYASDLSYLEDGFKRWSVAEEELRQVYAKKVELWGGESAYLGWQGSLVWERRIQFLTGRSSTVPLTTQEQAQLDAFDQEYKQWGEKQKVADDAQKAQLDPIIGKYCGSPEFFKEIDQEIIQEVPLD